MGWWSRLFGGSAEDRRLRAERQAAERAEIMQRHFVRAVGDDPEHASLSARRKAAIQLVMAFETAKGRAAWLAIARDFPSELPDALEQVGVCHHIDKDYAAAIESYEAAIRVGAEPTHLADNLNEARAALAALG